MNIMQFVFIAAAFSIGVVVALVSRAAAANRRLTAENGGGTRADAAPAPDTAGLLPRPEKLRQEKQFFEQLFLQSMYATQILDRDGNRVRVNAEWSRLFAIRRSNGKRPYNIFEDPEIARAGLSDGLRAVATEGKTTEWEISLQPGASRDRGRWFHIKAFPVRDREGKVANIVVLYEDVTDRRRAGEQSRRLVKEKELLLKEIHHRVKNNMQLMKSVLTLQSARVVDPAARTMFTDSANRINTMALIHEKLYQNERFGTVAIRDYLTYIADSLSRTYSRPDAEILIRTDVDDVRLDIDAAIPCGLLANELLSNAFKHAFGDRTRGAVMLAFKELQPPRGGRRRASTRYLLSVSDNGGGMPRDPSDGSPGSLGLELVTSLVRQLNGELSIDDRRRSGTVIEVKFPASKGTNSPLGGA